MPTYYRLTPMEILTLQEGAKIWPGIVENQNAKKAILYSKIAEKMHTTVPAVRNRFSRVRKRYDRANAFGEEYREFKKKFNIKGQRVL